MADNKYIVFVRHTETGIQVGREQERASRFFTQDPNAEIILYSATEHDARVGVCAAIEALRFANRLREKQ